jgi:hypothetical protein
MNRTSVQGESFDVFTLKLRRSVLRMQAVPQSELPEMRMATLPVACMQKNRFAGHIRVPERARTYGPCRGYVIDHVQALKHGDADDPGNMQWQTTAQAKAKDRWE